MYAIRSYYAFIGGVLTESLGWRSIFLLTAVFGVSLIILVKWIGERLKMGTAGYVNNRLSYNFV